MASLWTDVIDPAELTGYVREDLAAYEARKGSLAVYLPNRYTTDIVARFFKGQNGLVDEARFRAYDAEPEIGRARPVQRVVLELPALGQNIPVSEYTQLRTRGASDELVRNAILGTSRQVVRAVADAIERLRGIVLTTGKATIDQDNFQTDDDFGRDPDMTVTATTLWSAAGADPIGDLTAWSDLYAEKNGDTPGSTVMSRAAFRALAAHDGFKTQLVGGGSRPATEQQVQDIIAGAGLAPIVINDRRTASGRVIPADTVLLLPAPVSPDAVDSTDLGATVWGRTLTSTEADWGIEDVEQPGIVAGVYRNPKPPMIAEVISDAIGLPVLANANLSMAATVL